MKTQVTHVFSSEIRSECFKTGVNPTGYLRAPINGPVGVSTSGITGDELAVKRTLGRENHALYLFNARHYDYYATFLARTIAPGLFAENLIYTGPDETELRIGDVLRIGTVTLALTTPRVPCFKLSHFLNAAQSFPSAFSGTGKTGIYARIIETGELAPGDELVSVSSNTANATIAELNEALTGFSFDQDTIDRVLASPDLLPQAAQMIRDRMAAHRSGTGGLTAVPAVILRSTAIASDTSVIEIQSDIAMDWRPGQFVSISIDGRDGTQQHRCYSLIECDRINGKGTKLKIAVRKDAHSKSDTSVSAMLVESDIKDRDISLYPPTGEFTPPHDKAAPRLYIAGGIGITPILAHLRTLPAGTPTQLIYISRNLEAAVFAEELQAIVGANDNFQLDLWLTRDGDNPVANHGRPDIETLFAQLSSDATTYICGPVALIEDAKRLHREAGRDSEKLHYELFELPTMSDGSEEAATRSQISIEPNHLVGTWTRQGQTLLDWVEENTEFRPPAACRSDLCRTCQAQLEVGGMTYPAGINPPTHGTVLLCCARPMTDKLVIRLPEGTVTDTQNTKEKAKA